MDWERMKERLEAVLNAPIQFDMIPENEWNSLAGAQQDTQEGSVKSIIRDHNILFCLAKENGNIRVLETTEVLITASERQLVELMIEAMRSQERTQKAAYISDDEKKANQLQEWVLQQIDSGHSHTELPDTIVSQSSLYGSKIPFLLYGDYSQNQKVSYTELKKLLESFFEAEIILVPLLEKEWLVLGSESLLSSGGEEKDDDEDESLEQTLDAIGSGLYEMLANEWVGEYHLAVHYPIKPAKSLLITILQLRETIMLGRTFHVGNFIHLPWALHLEKLLYALQEEEKNEFIEQVLRGTDHVLDSETLMTLEQFFAMDCNVSETAKKLYIHRNTLLYRLDKFKNATGIDVRSFNDAVLIRVALLLYKVTKKK